MAGDFGKLLMGGLGGAQAGIGSAAGLKMAGVGLSNPWLGAIIGGGAILGGIGSLMGEDEETPEEKAEKRRQRGMMMFRHNVGRAMATRQPSNFGEMLNGPA